MTTVKESKCLVVELNNLEKRVINILFEEYIISTSRSIVIPLNLLNKKERQELEKRVEQKIADDIEIIICYGSKK